MVESSKYIRELRLAAENTADFFGVQNLKFSGEDFKSLVVSAKHVKNLSFNRCWIPLDCKFDFGDQLDSSFIQNINLCYCGSANYGVWDANLNRFENLLEAISKSLPLRNSLKTFYIGGCGVSRVNAEQICKKYELNELCFTGV